jgi:hypothetical protein
MNVWKRAAFVVAVTLAAALPSTGGSAQPVQAAAALSEQFNTTAIGSLPAGWDTDTSGGTAAVVAVPDLVDRSLQLSRTATDTTSAVEARRRLDPPLVGVVDVEARVRVDSATSTYNVLYVASSTGAPVASIGIRDGRYYNAGPNQALRAATMGWHVVRLEIRTAMQAFVDRGRRRELRRQLTGRSGCRATIRRSAAGPYASPYFLAKFSSTRSAG